MIAYIALALLFIVLVSSNRIIALFTSIIRKHILASMNHGRLATASWND